MFFISEGEKCVKMANSETNWTSGILSSFTSTINSTFPLKSMSSKSDTSEPHDDMNFVCGQLNDIMKSVMPDSPINIPAKMDVISPTDNNPIAEPVSSHTAKYDHVDCLAGGVVSVWSTELDALMANSLGKHMEMHVIKSEKEEKVNEGKDKEIQIKEHDEIVQPTVELDAVPSPFDAEESDFEDHDNVDEQDRDPRRWNRSSVDCHEEKGWSKLSTDELTCNLLDMTNSDSASYLSRSNTNSNTIHDHHKPDATPPAAVDATIANAVGDVFSVLGTVLPTTPVITPPTSPPRPLHGTVRTKVAAELDSLIRRGALEPVSTGPIDSVVGSAAAGLAGLMDSVVAGNETTNLPETSCSAPSTTDGAAAAAVHALAQVVASDVANRLAEVLPDLDPTRDDVAPSGTVKAGSHGISTDNCRNVERHSDALRELEERCAQAEIDEEMEEIAVLTPFQVS